MEKTLTVLQLRGHEVLGEEALLRCHACQCGKGLSEAGSGREEASLSPLIGDDGQATHLLGQIEADL